MSWFGSRTSSLSEHSSNKQKHKQIESLREQIPGVVEILRDEQYSVTTTVNGITLTLNISLPPQFPLISPKVTVSPPISHPWVNDQMVVDGSPLIKNFTVHSKLGRAIDQIIREFNDRPPQVISNIASYGISSTPQTSIPGTYQAPVTTGSDNFSSYLFSSIPVPSGMQDMPEDPLEYRTSAPNALRSVSKRYKCPPLPESFEEFSNMSTEELKKFLSDSDGTVLTENFVSGLDVIKMVQVDRERLMQENADQAAINLSHEPELQDEWTELQERFLEMETLKNEHEKKLNEQRQLIERYQHRCVVAQLKTLANDADTDSEIFAEEFLEAKVPVSEFIQKYKQLRKLHHLRKTKYEKLTNH